MINNDRNAGRRRILDKRQAVVFVSGDENLKEIKKLAKNMQFLAPKKKKNV